ncbi:MAG TPA: hypothetical protein VGF16_15775 [Bryobacteraceae bacterium]
MKPAAIIGLILIAPVFADDLPAGVLLLSRVKIHIKEELQRLAAISCLETVERELQPPKGKMRPLDTIRLEVLSSGNKELFASPGDRKFYEKHPLTFAGSGTLGDGLFGPYLREIVTSEHVSVQYKGEEEIGGRRPARYDYQIPPFLSGQNISIVEGSGRVGLHGSFWADPQTYDVTRLELHADNIPPALPVSEMTTRIDYTRTRLGDDLVLLPETAEVRLVKQSGEISHNRAQFTHCRVFGAESKIDFDAPDSPEPAPRFATVAVDDILRPLPAGLEVPVKLRSRISEEMAVGTLIDGAVANPVTLKRAEIIPAGSVVRGRIRRMERYTDPFPYFVIGLEFTEVEVQGIRHLFYADLLTMDSALGVSAFLTTDNTTAAAQTRDLFGARSGRQMIESRSLYQLPGVAAFFFKGRKLELPAGFRTVWKTRTWKP